MRVQVRPQVMRRDDPADRFSQRDHAVSGNSVTLPLAYSLIRDAQSAGQGHQPTFRDRNGNRVHAEKDRTESYRRQVLIVTPQSVTIGSMVDSARAFADRLNLALDKARVPQKGSGRQKHVAQMFGVSEKGARKWLEGEGWPDTKRIPEIAAALNVFGEWLLTGQGPMSPERPTVRVTEGSTHPPTVDVKGLERLRRSRTMRASGRPGPAVDVAASRPPPTNEVRESGRVRYATEFAPPQPSLFAPENHLDELDDEDLELVRQIIRRLLAAHR